MKPVALVVTGALAASVATGAFAQQTRAPVDEATGQAILASLPGGLRNRALDRMTQLDCGPVKCSRATAEERNAPIVSDAEVQAVYQLGSRAWIANHCGVDWRTRQVVPMMAYLRDNLGRSERQLAVLGAIHAMGWASTEPNAHRSCEDGLGRIAEFIDFSPEQFPG